MRVLLLPVGEETYAVDMAAAREVVAAPDLTRLPGAPSTLMGVFNLRGEIVPVFDTATLLGIGTAQPTFVAVIETASGPAGLAMTAMGASVDLSVPVGDTETPGTCGSFAFADRLVVLIDLEALLAPARLHG
ncbi:MAG TPA: chemotaxis protein CheW [Acidimicrobiales bacterium]|nr:chemotaxis protein CheW [Acidimicrobiales bacterium]